MRVVKQLSAGHRLGAATLSGTLVIAGFGLQLAGQPKRACDPDNGGITLPAGFCAQVVADGLGVARHMAVARNGDL